MAAGLYDVVPLLSRCTSNRFQGQSSGAPAESPTGWAGNFILMVELRKKILTFRDVIDLPPCDGSGPIHELVMGTVEDLHNLYPKIVSQNKSAETEQISMEQGLVLFYKALESVGDSWAKNQQWIENVGQDSPEYSLDNIIGLEQLGGKVLSKLKYMTRIAKRIFDVEEDDRNNAGIQSSTIGDSLTESYSDNKPKTCPSPDSPTSVPPELSSFRPLLSPLRLKAMQNLKPIGIKHIFSLDLSPVKRNSVAEESPAREIHSSEIVLSKRPLPTPMLIPPPPPLGAAKALRPKKATTKLRRSSHMGNLYRALKGKVEGSSLNGKQVHGKRSHIGVGSNGGKQGMADALAEMTKRSAYFQQIQDDVEKYSKPISEVKAAINSYQTKDMSELIKFHKFVEQHLEKLTDETQVLARFEGFPTKKLESLRNATALYLKLDEMVNTLKNWKVVPPLSQLLDKVESFFNKIKREIDALERTKDEESKRFQSHNIAFDFNVLVRIKESMVDVSSSCMELALEERKNRKMLWRAFQLAFRVYSFAGGQDERADVLTKELAVQIQTD